MGWQWASQLMDIMANIEGEKSENEHNGRMTLSGWSPTKGSDQKWTLDRRLWDQSPNWGQRQYLKTESVGRFVFDEGVLGRGCLPWLPQIAATQFEPGREEGGVVALPCNISHSTQKNRWKKLSGHCNTVKWNRICTAFSPGEKCLDKKEGPGS